MSPREVLRYVRADPFRPFRIRLTSGQTFDVHQPEMVRVGANSLLLFTYISDTPELCDKWETVSLLLIESVAPLEASVA